MTGQIHLVNGRRIRAGVVMAAILTAGGLTTAGCSASTPAPPAAAPPSAAAPPTGAARAHAYAVRGTISAENGGSWTVTTAKGVAYPVNITPSTAWGTKKAPATQQSFPVGNTVVVRGTHTGTTIDATRVVAAPATPNTPGTTPSATG